MKNRNLIIVSLVLLSSYSLAQTGYPKRITLDGDTVNCYTDEQVVKINQVYIQRNQYRELYDTCVEQNERRNIVIEELQRVNESFLKERKDAESVIMTGASIITEERILNKKQKRKVKFLKIKVKFVKGILSTATILASTAAVTFGVLYMIKK